MNKVKRILFTVLLALLLYLISPNGGTVFYLYNIRWVYVFLLSFLTSYIAMPMMIKLGHSHNFLDHPDEARKIHSIPVPLTGGMAIIFGFSITLLRNFNFTSNIKGILLAASIIFILGLVDDKYKLPASIKLIAQFLATTVVISFGIRVQVFSNALPLKDVLDIAVTFVGIIGITNAFNYMDGMDGEAGGLAIISGTTLFFIAMSNGDIVLSWLSIALVGSCLGFMPFNFPKAKVFLGDNGSTLLGFLLASIAVAGSWTASNTIVAIITPLLIFSIYIFDMIYTTVSRIKNGTVRNLKEWFEVTGRDHLHHRLCNLGFEKQYAVFFIWVCTLTISISAFAIRQAAPTCAFLIMIQVILMYLILVTLMLAGRKRS